MGVNISQEQYAWIQNQVQRFHKNKEVILKQTYYGTNEAHLDALFTKMRHDFKKAKFDYNRNEIRFMLKIVEPALNVLRAKVLPEYNKRATKDRAKYSPYLTKAKDTVTMLTALKELLESQL